MVDAHTCFVMSGNKLPVVFIRFNPDVFKIDNETQRVSLKTRYETVLDFVKTYEPTTPFSVKYFYYDIFQQDLELTLDEEFEESFNDFIIN